MGNYKLPILMYHNVTADIQKIGRLTIHQAYLEEQFAYLVKMGYKTYHLSELESLNVLSSKSIVITFDDVTTNQKDFVIPLLRKYQLKATFFVPFAYIGKSDLWNNGSEPIMSISDLKSLDPLIELGHHSYKHRPYASLTRDDIKEDFDNCYDICNDNSLEVYNAVAYPYGNFPKSEPEKSLFFNNLKENGMKFGLRIGNKVNRFPFKEPYEIQRIDVRGNEKMWKFKLNLKFGKLF